MEGLTCNNSTTSALDKYSVFLARLIIRGGWPANLEYSAKDASEAIEEYINLIIDDDLYRLDGSKLTLIYKDIADWYSPLKEIEEE